MAAAVALLLGVGPVAALVEPPTAALEGTVQVGAESRPAHLRFGCAADPRDGALSVELWVPEAFTRKDFDYDDFEGPDAPAGRRALTTIRMSGEHGMTEMSTAVAGWYAGDDPDTFVLAVSEVVRRPGKVARLLGALDATRDRILWVQPRFDDATRTLQASFALDPAAVAKIHAVVAPCLAAGAGAASATRPSPSPHGSSSKPDRR